MPSGIFKLNGSDLVKGLVMAIIGALISYFTAPSVDFATIDWGYILKIALITGFSYLGKNLISDSDGKILGHIG